MKRYRKTGKGLLGLIDKVKKPLGGILTVAFFITAFSMASADDYREAVKRQEMAAKVGEQTSIEETERIYYDVPLTEELQDVVIETAEERGMDPVLVFAVIEKESGYDPDASGDNGNSQGLMQIWQSFHEKRMEELGTVNLYDAKDNIITGIDILAEKLEAYQDIEKALIAYNAGDQGAKRYFDKGIYSTSYSKAVLKIAEEIKEK